jgi:hypothetical protein
MWQLFTTLCVNLCCYSLHSEGNKVSISHICCAEFEVKLLIVTAVSYSHCLVFISNDEAH